MSNNTGPYAWGFREGWIPIRDASKPSLHRLVESRGFVADYFGYCILWSLGYTISIGNWSTNGILEWSEHGGTWDRSRRDPSSLFGYASMEDKARAFMELSKTDIRVQFLGDSYRRT